MDAVDDYDFYENRRKAYFEKVKKRETEKSVRLRQAARDASLKWRANGEEMLNVLNLRIHGFKYILGPHSLKRTCMDEFNEDVASWKDDMIIMRKEHDHQKTLVQFINPTNHRKMQSRNNIISWKYWMLRDVHKYFYDKNPLTRIYVAPVPKIKVMRNLFRIFMQYVTVEKHFREKLKEARHLSKVVHEKMDLIHRTMRQCDAILECKSAQHDNPKGCEKCGVRYMGGTLSRVMYVTSISRDSGLATLVTLDFEVETLIEEEKVQIKIIEKVDGDLKQLEDVILNAIRVEIQMWWSIVLEFKRCVRNEQRIKKSLYHHRIKRLSKLKREIDTLVIERPPLDMDFLSDKYCDIIPELIEYSSQEVEKKRQRIRHMATLFSDRLHMIMEDARERARIEFERPAPPRPIMIRRVLAKKPPVLICLRPECKLRKFLTEDRLKTHMKIHFQNDVIRNKELEENHAAWVKRKQFENQFLGNVRGARTFTETADPTLVEQLVLKDRDWMAHQLCLPSIGGQQRNEDNNQLTLWQDQSLSSSRSNDADQHDRNSDNQQLLMMHSASEQNISVHDTSDTTENNNAPICGSGLNAVLVLSPAKPKLDSIDTNTPNQGMGEVNSLDDKSNHAITTGESTKEISEADEAALEEKQKAERKSTLRASMVADYALYLEAARAAEEAARNAKPPGFAPLRAAVIKSSSSGNISSNKETSDAPTSSSTVVIKKNNDQNSLLEDQRDGTNNDSDNNGKNCALIDPTTITPIAVRKIGSLKKKPYPLPDHVKKLDWVNNIAPVVYSMNNAFNAPLFYLELVSKQNDIEVASRVALDKSVVRFGTHASCECLIKCKGSALREEKISKIHCLLFCNMIGSNASNSSADASRRLQSDDYNELSDPTTILDGHSMNGGNRSLTTTSTSDHSMPTKSTSSSPQNSVTVVDNRSGWGTYVVSLQGTLKAPLKASAGFPLTPGMLVCIGVMLEGPNRLSATEANGACVVYRVRCLELEKQK